MRHEPDRKQFSLFPDPDIMNMNPQAKPCLWMSTYLYTTTGSLDGLVVVVIGGEEEESVNKYIIIRFACIKYLPPQTFDYFFPKCFSCTYVRMYVRTS